MQNISEYELKISGSTSLLEKLETDQRLNIVGGELDIYSVEKRDNQDGTFKLIYKGKFVSAVDIESKGKKVPVKDKTKKSLRNRMGILSLQQELEANGIIQPMDDETFYNYMMDGMYHTLPQIYSMISKNE